MIIIKTFKLGGGAERIASLIATYLQKSGYCVICVPYLDVANKYPLSCWEYSPLDISEPTKIFQKVAVIPLKMIKTAKIIRQKKPDLILSFMEDANIASLGGILLSGEKTKAIISTRTNYTMELSHSPYKLSSAVTDKLARHLYRFASLMITPSKGVLLQIQDVFEGEIKGRVIENPVDVGGVVRLSEEEVDFSSDFITVGRLTRQKGHWFLVRSFGEVVEHYPSATLAIIGDGELRGKLEELIKLLKLEDNVFLLGRQENPFKYVAKAKTFVFTSLWEGFPNTLLEALTLNKLVISTDCDFGPREILAPELGVNEKINYPYYGSYGILTKPFSDIEIWDDRPLIKEEKMLAELMLKTLEEPKLRRKYSTRGLKRVQKNTPQKITKKWKKTIEKLN